MAKTIFSTISLRSFILVIISLLLITSPLLFLDKEIPSLWVNSWHSPFLDVFFRYITYLGDGLILIPVLIFLLFNSYTLSAIFAVTTAFEAVLVQLVLKKGFFAYLDRPSAYIPNFDQLHTVAGENIHSLHTFPSGHTQTIFMVIVFIALAAKKRNGFNILLIVVALLTGLSRIYLLQHFFVDVWVGAAIGFSIPVMAIYLLQKYGKYPKSDKSLKY